MVRPSALSAAAALALTGCREKAAPPLAPPPAPATPAPQATPLRGDVGCTAPLDAPGAREKLREKKGELRIGALAGLKDADDDNVTWLKKLVAELKRRGAEVLIADGDLGDNPDEQETLLGALAESGLPVLAAAGNREVRSELDAAEAELRKKGARIVDLSHTRIVDLGDATIVGLPGAFERRQLHSDGACIYVGKDIDALGAALEKFQGAPALLVAAVPPRGQDARALDVSEGQNLGDPRLNLLLKRAPFGIFGQVWESGGRAIDAKGAPVKPGVESEQLYLNPGAADHTPWPMNDGTTVAGQAALLTIRGKRATWQPVRLPLEEPALPASPVAKPVRPEHPKEEKR
jgi:hypothetical protein